MRRVFRVELESRDAAGEVVTHRFASEAYMNRTVEAPPNDFVDGRVTQPGLLPKSMFGPDQVRGEIAIGAGAIVLSNPDGELDYLLDYAFDGMKYEVIWTGDVAEIDLPLSTGFIEQPIFNEEQIVFAVRDAGHALDVPLLTVRYAGTNALPAGVEGTAEDIKGQPKPLWLGECFNVTPVCVNTSRLIYQVDGVRGLEAGWSLDVFDSRASLTQGSDYTSQADMESNAPSSGNYRVWPAGGMFRLGSAPSGPVTCDGVNPMPNVYGFDPLSVQMAVGHLSNVPVFFPPYAAGFENVPVGMFVQDGRTRLAAMNEMLQSFGGFLTTSFNIGDQITTGQLRSFEVEEPFTRYVLGESEIVDEPLQQVVPGDGTRGLPVWRVNVRYRRNYTTMGASELAGISQAIRAEVAEEYRTVSASDPGVQTQWPAAGEITVTTCLVNESDAQAEADRLLSLFGVPRKMWRFKITGSTVRSGDYEASGLEVPTVGVPVFLTYPRFGLEAGKFFCLTAFDYDAAADIYTFTVWG